jgi:hypothetical protein
MRSLPALALVAVLLPTAAAQDDCSDPLAACPWVVAVSAAGFDEVSWTFTQGEWYNLTVDNSDEVPHRITVATYGIDLTAPADGEASQTFLLEHAGDFEVRDVTTGRTATLRVTADDHIAGTGGAGGGGTTSKGTPAAAAVLALAGVALAAAAWRRR